MAVLQKSSPTARPLLIAVLICLITLLVFWRAVGNDFVNYDDPDYVSKNVWVQMGLTLKSIQWGFTSGHASNWHPLTWLSHMFDWELFGDNPRGHHFTNVLFHSLNAALLFLVLRTMTGFFWRAAFIAALFALHPLRVESVAWISERKDVLSMFFGLISIWFYTSYTRAKSLLAVEPKWSGRSVKLYLVALAFFALSLMSKPMLVTLPFLLLLLDFWPLGRLSLPFANPVDAEKNSGNVLQISSAILEKVPFFLLIVGSSIVTFLVQQEGGAVSSALSLQARLANAAISYCRYLFKLIWPEKLSVLYPHPGAWPAELVLGATTFLVVVSALTVWQLRRRPWLFVGWFWFLGTAVPVIGIVQVGIQSMADRYTYIPMIGIYIVLTWAVCELTARLSTRSSLLTIMSLVVLALCSWSTFQQIAVWKNSMSLFEHATAVTDKNYLAYNNLGFFLSEQARGLRGEARLQKIDQAIEKYQKSVAIKPNYEEALNNLGHALAEKGQHAQAIPFYRSALGIKPNLLQAHNNLGNALSEIGQTREAIEHYEIVLAKEPGNVDAHNNLGVALAITGRFEEGMTHLLEAVKLNPKNASARSNLGNAYAMQRKLDLAAEEYRAALQSDPLDARTHNNLANVFAELGNQDDAILHYRKALDLEPINPEANFNLALTLIRKGEKAEAMKHVQEALRLRPNYPEAQRQLSALRGQP